MQQITIPFGSGTQSCSISDEHSIEWIVPPEIPGSENPIKVIEKALSHPLDFQFPSGIDHVAIAVNDKTRPVPHHHILPPLLDWLNQHHIPDEKITLLIATGTHLPMKQEEIRSLIPLEVLERVNCISHDCDNAEQLVFIGVTSRGTPVWVNQKFAQADLKICTGDIEPHHFAGFSGGVKTAAIGLAGRKTVNRNHAWITDPKAWIGIYEGNPLREDIEEIGSLMGVDFVLNTILNEKKEIVHALAGHPRQVMKTGIPLALKICTTEDKGLFDLVIASAGGYPKDINFYQAQKALTHATTITRKGGTIILVAECREGSGNQAFEEFMKDVSTPDEVFAKFAQQPFRVGPHKGYQVARIVRDYHVYLVSTISPEIVRNWLIQPCDTLKNAVNLALADIKGIVRIGVMPYATTTLTVSSRNIF